jgi:hypothetical protein
VRNRYASPAQERQAGRAELIGDACSALGITVRGSAPVLKLCRRLLEIGRDPTTPLRVFRGETLALRVRSIGEGAGLELNGDGTGFRPRRQPDAASPVGESASAGVRQRGHTTLAHGRPPPSFEQEKNDDH